MNENYLQQALALASAYQGFCAPNPAVGALVVKDGTVIAQGVHRGCGSHHAERDALKQLTPEQAQGATVYVTLEPCCHQGRTPPCTELLIEHQVSKVVFGYLDPNPQVAGKGKAQLEQAGILCEYNPLPDIAAFYEPYHFWTRTGRPYTIGKLALSLDGKIAGPQGEPLAITGKACAEFTHQGRLASDGLLTTATTIIQDDPLLNVRLGEESIPKPLFILDTHLKLPLDARIWHSASHITLFHSKTANLQQKQSLEAKGGRLVAVPTTAQGLDLTAVLQHIGEAGIHRLWVEAGGRCFESLLLNDLLQQAYLYVSPKILGEENTPAFTHSQVQLASKAKAVHWSSLGPEALCELRFTTIAQEAPTHDE